MNKTSAIKEACRDCSITGRGRSWTVWGPYHVDEPRGPSTSRSADSYAKAVRIRAQWRAEIAVALMDLTGDERQDAWDEIDFCAHDPYSPHDVRGLVNAGLRAIERTRERLAQNAARAAAAA